MSMQQQYVIDRYVSSFHRQAVCLDAVAALVSEEANRGSTEASGESEEQERSVRFDDFAASDNLVLAIIAAVVVAVLLVATTVHDRFGSRRVRIRVATVGAGDLDGVDLVALLAAVQAG
jgi:hypothetical protein